MSHKKVLIIGAIVAAIIFVLYLTRNKIKKLIMSRPEFIDAFAGIVKESAKGTGLFPSLFMAQAILESSDYHGVPGNSTLAAKHNNYFGVKASKGWTGQTVIMPTHEVIGGKSVIVQAPFRKYSTPLDSFKDRVQFLLRNKNYAKAGVFKATTPEAQAHDLKLAGYATDPQYPNKLINLINKYNLKTLDV